MLGGEAKSEGKPAEEIKIVLGCCRILNFTSTAYGVWLTPKVIRIYKTIRRDDVGKIQFNYCELDYTHEPDPIPGKVVPSKSRCL